MSFWGDEQFTFFESTLFAVLGRQVDIFEARFLSGGDINTAAQVITSEGTFFVKWNYVDDQEDVAFPDMFEAEAKGLDLLRETKTFCIPHVIGYGRQGDKTYLVLEYIEPGSHDETYWEKLGQSLAALHSHTQPQFGLFFNNYIGSLTQLNTLTSNGYDFFFEHRLLPQAGLAFYKDLLPKTAYDALFRLQALLPELLPAERPALIHGDLWSGNVMINEAGAPVLIDPAIYYGFREAELAFTRLFGGFDERFYEAYDEALPLQSGFRERIAIYNLYPLLVHVNLFGSGYVSGVERVLKQF
ncbi:fructosamine kinase family protein [Spirosoma flavus]